MASYDYEDMGDNGFRGRYAVVTGGSDGLGKDFCKALCRLGCHVYFCARDEDRGKAVERELGPTAHFFPADLADSGQVVAFTAFVREKAGRIDYLINNMAHDDRTPIDTLTPEDCDRMWDVNLRSVLLVTRACLDMLRAGRGKSIVNIGTTNWMLGEEPFTLYAATKGGILGFTRSLAREVGKEGIRVNMVSPGWIMTTRQLRERVTPTDKSDLLRDQSLKFLLEPSHVTPAVLFLLGPTASGITGQNLVVDGGKLLQ